MIHSRGANASTVELVWTQILQGIGGGFAALASQVGAQASVPHADVAMVIATVLLVTEIGGAAGASLGMTTPFPHQSIISDTHMQRARSGPPQCPQTSRSTSRPSQIKSEDASLEILNPSWIFPAVILRVSVSS